MRVILLDGRKINKIVLPNKIEGVFSFQDDDNETIVNIEGSDSGWLIRSNYDATISMNDTIINETILQPLIFYHVLYNDIDHLLFAENIVDTTIGYFNVTTNMDVTIGREVNNIIAIQNDLIGDRVVKLHYDENGWELCCDDPSFVYINGYVQSSNNLRLTFGDSIFIYGLRLVLYKDIISINNTSNNVIVSTVLSKASLKMINTSPEVPSSDSIKEIDLYNDKDYFFKTPRLRRFVETYDLNIVSPPPSQSEEKTPLLLNIGPSFTLICISMITSYQSINSILKNESSIKDNILPLALAVLMIFSSVLWPRITEWYTSKTNKSNEKKRVKKYEKYLARKEAILKQVFTDQKNILSENLISAKECEKIILDKSRNLWERRNDQKDFLTVRIGVGSVPLDIKSSFKEDEFSLDEDVLLDKVKTIVNNYKFIPDCPVGYSFAKKNVTALMGNNNDALQFLDSILIQLLSFHSYDDLKLVFLISKKNIGYFDKYKELNHCFSNDKQVRFYATEEDEQQIIDKYLNDIISQRLSKNVGDIKGEDDETSFQPHYLIIVDNYPMVRKLDSIINILSSKKNIGFSIICVENQLSKLPSECEDYIMLYEPATVLCTNMHNYNIFEFIKDSDTSIDVKKCCNVLANVPIEFAFDMRNLPKSLGFLEMFGVGKVEQLNTLNRWRVNSPMESLKAQIGINDEGKPIYLDLHEKSHGPHGLIAGTTGSGKSEFIITYILSMAINYNPNEVAFILIDYKGGGLAGAFENKTLGLKLPHLSGTITNLDKASLNRTLVSINSELQRRQMKFNEVREELGESTIDIYKYQRLFREGKIKDPMPHLFIISDEFAELKNQQPEFMDDLVSAARIGRSLGVHLILATQKPSGVVTGEIWANSKFKVCLKVQDTSDSSEMLKKPDAAYLTNAGRFYLEVGNDEIYLLGQSGWSGTNYEGTETIKRKYDRNIAFIDNVGNIIKNEDSNNKKSKDNSKGDELSNVLKYIVSLADKENLKASSLWLDPLPEIINIDELESKYNYKADGISVLIGEVDQPSKQIQNYLDFRLDDNGNTAVYGNTAANREMFLGTMIYYLCTHYSPEDINIYITDFGSESLRVYGNFPQVGDVIFIGDKDKFNKTINLIANEMDFRKELFADYNGEYRLYNKNSGSKVPLKIFVFNNFDAVRENYSYAEEYFINFSRDCERYGIVLVFSASNATQLPGKIRKSIQNVFALDMNSKDDYYEVFDRVGQIIPASYSGRGLVQLDILSEFQTAIVHDADSIVEFIKEKAKEQKGKYTTVAPNIPVLPDVITNDMFDKYIKDVVKIPIGMYKDNLKVAYYNFFNDYATIVASSEVEYCKDFVSSLIYSIKKLNQVTILLDPDKMFESLGGSVNTYVNDNFDKFIHQFENFLDTKVDGKPINVFVIMTALEKLRDTIGKSFDGFFRGIKTFDNVKLIFVDSSYNYKKLGMDEWYSSSVNTLNGIWIGDGFGEQNVIEVKQLDSSYRQQITKQYAWLCIKGNANLIKIVGEEEKVEDEE